MTEEANRSDQIPAGWNEYYASAALGAGRDGRFKSFGVFTLPIANRAEITNIADSSLNAERKKGREEDDVTHWTNIPVLGTIGLENESSADLEASRPVGLRRN